MNRTHLFLTVSPVPSCTVWLPIQFHGLTSRINSKGYQSLVPGLISIFLKTVWVPLMDSKQSQQILSTNFRSILIKHQSLTRIVKTTTYCYIHVGHIKNFIND